MPFSHHSHSGQFCPGHAKNSLEEVVTTAIAKEMRVLALTEHMPRHDHDLYPEEIEAGTTLQSLIENESAYITEALRLRAKYGHQISLPIGFESDWCGPHSAGLIERSLAQGSFDFYVGSIHHVRGIPIDYDRRRYEQARSLNGGTDVGLFAAYFDEQLEMLQRVQPPVVGHLDLIRLKSDEPNIDWTRTGSVWPRILRNLDFIASYGGMLEINTAAWRKGMQQPYPSTVICRQWSERGGAFCLSDDSHGIDQVATNYDRLLQFLDDAGITTLRYLEHDPTKVGAYDRRFPTLAFRDIAVNEIRNHRTLV